jgi:lipoprotein-anchoring transpeptidase ErfK/SrfK
MLGAPSGFGGVEMGVFPRVRVAWRRHRVLSLFAAVFLLVATVVHLASIPVSAQEWSVPPEESFTETLAQEVTETTEITDWSFGPGPQQGAWKEIVVSISAQSMWAYEEGELVISSLVSTGTAEVPETTTPMGWYSVLAKFDAQTMEGTISGEYYRVEDVPYVMYFDDFGNALHGTYWHANFGAPMSHGCINLPMDIAAWMYEWAPVGTAVTVVA